MIGQQLSAALRAFGPALSNGVESAVLLGGAALIAYGAWEVYRPAGPITAGVLLIAGVILRARGS
jgi:hypothetical protein